MEIVNKNIICGEVKQKTIHCLFTCRTNLQSSVWAIISVNKNKVYTYNYNVVLLTLLTNPDGRWYFNHGVWTNEHPWFNIKSMNVFHQLLTFQKTYFSRTLYIFFQDCKNSTGILFTKKNYCTMPCSSHWCVLFKLNKKSTD